MRIGFLNNQIDNRGTGNAVLAYAHYNEEILGNTSKIFTLSSENHDAHAMAKYLKRFGEIHLPAPETLADCDALYHIKSGEDDGQRFGNIPYLVHAVFNSQVHGTRYAAISEWMGLRDSIPFVPHIIVLADTDVHLRNPLNIPDDATVFGRIGGNETFDIPWVWNAIEEILSRREDYWFIFVNTPVQIQHPRVLYFPATTNDGAKRAFINTCDAMLHARTRGETFGISVGEFSVLGKPIFTYSDSYEKAHIFELKGTAKTYKTKEHLLNLLMEYKKQKAHPFYTKHTPEIVMEKFKEVFLD